MPDLSGAIWGKSSRSSNQGNCVEVAGNLPGLVAVRDSTAPHGPALTFDASAWQTFVRATKRR